MEEGAGLHLTAPELLPWDPAGLLSGSRLDARLDKLPGWYVKTSPHPASICRDWITPDFDSAARLAATLARLAAAAQHHPDISFGWGFIHVRWRTQDLGGIHENDILLALATERLLAASGHGQPAVLELPVDRGPGHR